LIEAAHRGGVHARPTIDAEVPAVRYAERQLERLVVERLRDQDAGRLDRVERQTEGPHQDVGRATRQHAQRGLGAGKGVDGLVDRPVAGEHDDQVDALVDGLCGELRGVAAFLGLGDLQPEVGRERLLDHGQDGLGHRAGHRIHDEQEALEAHRHAGSISGSDRSPIAP
jgi:hypothetical protein